MRSVALALVSSACVGPAAADSNGLGMATAKAFLPSRTLPSHSVDTGPAVTFTADSTAARIANLEKQNDEMKVELERFQFRFGEEQSNLKLGFGVFGMGACGFLLYSIINAFVNRRSSHAPAMNMDNLNGSELQSKHTRSRIPMMGFDMEKYIGESEDMRIKHLEEQAMYALKIACENFDHAVFPNAMIAGDVVITHLLHRLGYLKNGKCKVMVVDTFHLFPETMQFLKEMEDFYDFKAEVFCAEGVPVEDKAAYDAKYGADLWKEDIEQYDKVCKVEPFQRGLKTLETDCMINGRTRWQGFERAWIDLFENAPIGGGLAKCNPIAYWTLEDTFKYIAKYKIPHHPLHAKGYPSIGDAKDTIPIPEDGSVTFKDFEFQGDKVQWLDYATERKGRFVGLANKDGSTKTECGIHVAGAEKTFDRDLWEDPVVKPLNTTEEVDAFVSEGKPAILAVYAPWCQFCQAMEEEYEKLAKELNIPVAKFRGDEQRDYVQAKLNTKSFPTVNVVTPDGKVIKYESEDRTVAAFKEFVDNTVGAPA